MKFHIRIFAPGLISLQLDNFDGLAPSLEYMPSLETAYVWLHNSCYDSCHSNRQNCEYEDCSCHAYPVDEGVLLHGLSNAVNLELVGDTYFELVHLHLLPFLLLLLCATHGVFVTSLSTVSPAYTCSHYHRLLLLSLPMGFKLIIFITL